MAIVGQKKNPFKSQAFAKFFGVSMVAFFVILVFVALIWISGGRQSGIPDEIDFVQLKTPASDAPVVVFETSLGTVKAVLYPEDAPNYCKYFIDLVNSGYYDESYFCAVVSGAYALGGAKAPNPNEAETPESDLTAINAETSPRLWPLKGSLISFVGTSGIWPFETNLAGSTFLFINTLESQYMNESALKRSYGDALGGAYATYGGVPNFSKKYTVFGQIYSGLDVFEQIMAAETLESSQPANDIVIKKAYISTYGAEN